MATTQIYNTETVRKFSDGLPVPPELADAALESYTALVLQCEFEACAAQDQARAHAEYAQRLQARAQELRAALTGLESVWLVSVPDGGSHAP